jgi:hypothetical protein
VNNENWATESAAVSINELLILLEEKDLKLYIENFYTEHESRENCLWRRPEPILFKCANTLTIEGWIHCTSGKHPQSVSIASIYGDTKACILLTRSSLAQRSDLPPNGKYFSLTVPLASLLLKNQLRIQIHRDAETLDAALISVTCTAPIHQASLRYISLLASGRSGSTLLSKVLNTIEGVLSPSQESEEHCMLRSMLMSMLNGIVAHPISTQNFTGAPETYLEVPFNPRHNPMQSVSSFNNLERTFDTCWDTALAYYSKKILKIEANNSMVLVEKNWGSPLLPLLSQRLGVLNIVLLRHPIAVANSIREYHKRTNYGIGFDPYDSDRLTEYVTMVCRSLDWLAEYTPNKLVVRYEDLTDDPLNELSKIKTYLEILNPSAPPRAISLGLQWDRALTPTKGHKTTSFGLSEAMSDNIKHACSFFTEKYYPFS